ncbi:MAG: leucine-rich repeat domain-containing protein [Cyanobacteria bacterium P01_A01_bin.116]
MPLSGTGPITTGLMIMGPPVAKKLLEAFGFSPAANAGIGALIDAGAKKVFKTPAQEKTFLAQIEAVAEGIKADMQPLFVHEARGMAPYDKEAVIGAIAHKLAHTPLTLNDMINEQLDAAKLTNYLLTAQPDATKNLGNNGTALYEQGVAIAGKRLIEAAPQVKGYAQQLDEKILKQLDAIATVETQKQAKAKIEAERFDQLYREVLINKLNKLEMFGMNPIDSLTGRQSLIEAYITLSVESDEGESKLSLLGDEEQEASKKRSTLTHATYKYLDLFPQNKSHRIDEIVCKRQKLIVRGDAGAGKSTLLQWLAVKVAEQTLSTGWQRWNEKVPFFIRLREIVGKEFPNVEDFPALISKQCTAEMPPKWVQNTLKSGRALVLIDGVDELPRAERADFLESLKDLVQVYGNATYIVTSRPYGLKDEEGQQWEDWEDWITEQQFTNCTLKPMGNEEVKQFVVQWHRALASHAAYKDKREELIEREENLQQLLKKRSELQRLASTPLLCAMICALHIEQLGDLPKERLKLYEACIDMLLNQRDRRRKINLECDESYPELTDTQKLELIQSLALKLMRCGGSDIEAQEADSHFEKESQGMRLPEEVTGKKIRDLFVERSGLLRSTFEGRIDFAHRTFQEYLAVMAILDEGNFKELLQKVKDDQWKESIIVAAGKIRKPEVSQLFQHLIDEGNNDKNQDKKRYLHLLAIACLETVTKVEPTMREQVLACGQDLLPPQDDEEIATVIRAGDEIIPLLKYKVQYSGEEACQNIKTLVTVGTEKAMEYLEEYAQAKFEEWSDRHNIGSDIGKGWDTFNQKRYILNVLCHLTALSLSKTQVSDIEFLKQLPQLQDLSLNDTQVSDLEPLKQLSQLQLLYLNDTQVSDIEPLKQLSQLQLLFLNNTQVSDIEPLKQLSQLQFLFLSNTQVSDIEPFKQLSQLQHLYLSNTQIFDVEPLKQLSQLQLLSLNNTQIPDIEPLKQLSQLQHLSLNNTQIPDIEPLKQLSQLQTLLLSSTQVSDLEPLKQLSQLRHLDLSGTQVSDLEPLKQLSQLRHLDLSNTQIPDIEPLKQLSQLRHLDLSNTQICNFSPLKHIKGLSIIGLDKTASGYETTIT